MKYLPYILIVLVGLLMLCIGRRQGFSNGVDYALTETEISTNKLRTTYKEAQSEYKERASKLDSIISEYEAWQVESFINHSEIPDSKRQPFYNPNL